MRCFPSKSQLALFAFYLIMVSLNGLAVAKFQRGATDGYAYSYLQPDGSTFSIWGVIYTWLIFLCFSADRVAPKARERLMFAFCLNGLWLLANGAAVEGDLSYWLAVAVLAAYAIMLWSAYFVLDVNYAGATVVQKMTVFGPLSLNMAWVTLAALLNFTNTAMNEKLDFSKKENRTAVGGPDWAIGCIGLAALIGAFLAFSRSDFVFPSGLAWGLAGIVRNQTKGSSFPHNVNEMLRETAQGLMGLAVALAVIAFLKSIVSFPYVTEVFGTNAQMSRRRVIFGNVAVKEQDQHDDPLLKVQVENLKKADVRA